MVETFPLSGKRVPKGLKKIDATVYLDKYRGVYWVKKDRTLYKLNKIF